VWIAHEQISIKEQRDGVALLRHMRETGFQSLNVHTFSHIFPYLDELVSRPGGTRVTAGRR
jgi:hypothetical protein